MHLKLRLRTSLSQQLLDIRVECTLISLILSKGSDTRRMQTGVVSHAVVAFSPNVGLALNRAVIGLAGSLVGGALGILVIALVSALAMGFSYEDHPVTLVSHCKHHVL